MAKKRNAKPTPAQLRGLRPNPMPAFEPTQEQRNFVAAMAGFRMTWDEMRSLIINPRTGEPISKETLGKAFPRELETGKARLKSIVQRAYLSRVEKEDWSAVAFGMRNFCGYQESGVSVSVGQGSDDGSPGVSKIEVSFVHPKANGKDDDE